MRMVVSLADFDDSRWINLTGVSGHPFSDHYTDQTDLWARGETLPWAFSRDAVEVRRAHPDPAAGRSPLVEDRRCSACHEPRSAVSMTGLRPASTSELRADPLGDTTPVTGGRGARRGRRGRPRRRRAAPRRGCRPGPGPARGRSSRRPGPAARRVGETARPGTSTTSAVATASTPEPRADRLEQAAAAPARATVGAVVRRPVEVEVGQHAPAASPACPARRRRVQQGGRCRARRRSRRTPPPWPRGVPPGSPARARRWPAPASPTSSSDRAGGGRSAAGRAARPWPRSP